MMMTSTQASAIDIRLAGLGDAAIMSALHAVSFARSWDEGAMAQFLGAPGCISLLVSTGDGEPPQGLLIARRASDEAELLTLAVHPNCRRLGLARALLTAAIGALRASGVKRLFLEVEEGNAPARFLYQSFGAVAVGRRPGYYEHGADAGIFSLAL